MLLSVLLLIVSLFLLRFFLCLSYFSNIKLNLLISCLLLLLNMLISSLFLLYLIVDVVDFCYFWLLFLFNNYWYEFSIEKMTFSGIFYFCYENIDWFLLLLLLMRDYLWLWKVCNPLDDDDNELFLLFFYIELCFDMIFLMLIDLLLLFWLIVVIVLLILFNEFPMLILPTDPYFFFLLLWQLPLLLLLLLLLVIIITLWDMPLFDVCDDWY